MLDRHLHLPFEVVCITGEPEGIDPRVRIVAPPAPLPGAIRCRRRMWQFAAARWAEFGARVLAIDLDVVIVDDLTPIVMRSEPIVCWRVGYANVFSGSFILYDVGALDGAWRAYAADPEGYPAQTSEKLASDQAMLNHYIRTARTPITEWTERDGIRTYFGAGYERLAHHGVGPTTQILPPGTRVVVLGSKDKGAMDAARLPWINEHWR